MNLKFIILVYLLQVFFTKFSYAGYNIPRKWTCNTNSHCVSVDDEDDDDDNQNNNNEKSASTYFDSQNNCRLSCGRYGSLWPRPTLETVLSNDRIQFNPADIRFNIHTSSNTTKQFLQEMSRIFHKNTLKECKKNCTRNSDIGVLVKITVESSSLELSWTTNESYVLVINSSDKYCYVNIEANTVYGARHGLETLSQLITGTSSGGLIMVSSAIIKDIPKYSHRGVLLDTARNYIPVRNIKSTLDAMSSSKMNVFHWHATDSQSFPLEITRVPELQRFGAYSSTQVYSRSDIKHIINYAKYRGIRVIIEIDSPSHAGNGWQWGPQSGLGDLAICINQQPWRSYCIQPPCGQMNPINNNLYDILKEVFEDIAEVIPKEETMHMGGDEVFIPCWNSTSEIIKFLQRKGLDTSMTSFLRLWSDFHSKNIETWNEIKSKNGEKNEFPVILWSSHLTDPTVIENYLPKEKYIIQTWVEDSLPLNDELLEKGYRLIISTKNAWYLDHGFWGRTDYYNWKTVYNNRISNHPLVLGGEVCMWSEYVDENSLDSRVWPRAGAAAERLWSDPETDAIQSESRFFRYRERLISRGIKPEAITPKWCTLHEGECL